MKHYFLFLLFLCPLVSFSQTFDEWKNKRAEEQKAFVNKRALEYQKLQKDYEDFKRERNLNFAKYLEKRWKEKHSNEGLSRWEEPKPIVAPVDTTIEFVSETIPMAYIPPVASDPVIEESKPTIVIPPILVQPDTNYDVRDVYYFGLELEIPWDPLLSVTIKSSPSESTIAEYWTRLSDTPYDILLIALWKLKEELKLNDWAYFLLVENVSKEYCTDKNSQRLFQWFFLSQSAYDARVGFDGESLTLLIPSKDRVNDYLFLNISGIDYFLLDPLDRVFTYDKNFVGAENYFKFGRSVENKLGKKVIMRKLNFEYKGKSYTFDFLFNRYQVEFDNKYLPVDFPIYFNAALSEEMYENLHSQLLPIVSEMNKKDAVQFLLSFVQYAFEYQTDGEQFGYENYLFADESIFYPYVDCEDRSFLFSKMVRELLDLPVVGLFYPGHLATAVALDGDVDGAFIEFENNRYFVCDPTYIGAEIGQGQPEFEKVKAEIILVD